MSLFGRDTHPRAVKVMLAGYRNMTASQKVQRVCDLSSTTRQLAAARLRTQYPQATERELKLRLAALTLGRKTTMRAFGWDPEREGW
jgi:hypothetical protein